MWTITPHRSLSSLRKRCFAYWPAVVVVILAVVGTMGSELPPPASFSSFPTPPGPPKTELVGRRPAVMGRWFRLMQPTTELDVPHPPHSKGASGGGLLRCRSLSNAWRMRRAVSIWGCDWLILASLTTVRAYAYTTHEVLLTVLKPVKNRLIGRLKNRFRRIFQVSRFHIPSNV